MPTPGLGYLAVDVDWLHISIIGESICDSALKTLMCGSQVRVGGKGNSSSSTNFDLKTTDSQDK